MYIQCITKMSYCETSESHEEGSQSKTSHSCGQCAGDALSISFVKLFYLLPPVSLKFLFLSRASHSKQTTQISLLKKMEFNLFSSHM